MADIIKKPAAAPVDEQVQPEPEQEETENASVELLAAPDAQFIYAASHLRVTALETASRHFANTHTTPEQLVGAAEKLLTFLEGDSADA